jgi:hypothetical protein
MAVASMLQRGGLQESQLGCGPHAPFDGEARRRLLQAGERPTRLHNNCSGKHAGSCCWRRLAVMRRPNTWILAVAASARWRRQWLGWRAWPRRRRWGSMAAVRRPSCCRWRRWRRLFAVWRTRRALLPFAGLRARRSYPRRASSPCWLPANGGCARLCCVVGRAGCLPRTAPKVSMRWALHPIRRGAAGRGRWGSRSRSTTAPSVAIGRWWSTPCCGSACLPVARCPRSLQDFHRVPLRNTQKLPVGEVRCEVAWPW